MTGYRPRLRRLESQAGNAAKITEAAITFMQYVAKGFSSSAYGNTLLAEVCDGCIARMSRKPAKIQTLGRVLLEEPNRKGVARFLVSIEALARTDPDFDAVELDCHQENLGCSSARGV